MKIMMWLLAAWLLVGAACVSADDQPGGRGEDINFSRHWHDGKAELDGYQLTVSRYGQERPGTCVIPPGGASACGALGYVVAALELEEVPSRMYVPLGSGTTVSGLLAGLMLRGATCEVVAVRVAA